MSTRTAHPVSSRGLTSRTPATAIIRPAGPADTAALGDFFAALPLLTRYLRFFAPVRPPRPCSACCPAAAPMSMPWSPFETASSSGMRWQQTGPEPKARDTPAQPRTPISRQ
jgi:hypothetical protein